MTTYNYGLRQRQARARVLADERAAAAIRRAANRARLQRAISVLEYEQADTADPGLIAAFDDALARLQLELEAHR